MTITVDPALLAICGILFGAGWLVTGYILGHDDGVEVGFDAGWASSQKHVRSLIDRIKADR
jgi:hypothetical protein